MAGVAGAARRKRPRARIAGSWATATCSAVCEAVGELRREIDQIAAALVRLAVLAASAACAERQMSDAVTEWLTASDVGSDVDRQHLSFDVTALVAELPEADRQLCDSLMAGAPLSPFDQLDFERRRAARRRLHRSRSARLPLTHGDVQMNLFKHLESARTFPPRRILLYGIRGIGTSSFAAGLSAPVFVPADESVAHIECPLSHRQVDFADLMQALQELYIEPHDYRTVIIDPLEAVERLIRDEVCHQHNVKHLTDLPARPATMQAHWQRLLRRLDLLHSDIDLHVVLVGRAHETLTRCERPDDATVQQRNCAGATILTGVSAAGVGAASRLER